MIAVLLALLIVLAPAPLDAQQGGAASSGAASAPAPKPLMPPTRDAPLAPALPMVITDESPSGGASAPGQAQKAQTAEELAASSLGQDITSASYYELVAWCQSLGIGDDGSRKDLQDRLASHYRITLPPPAPSSTRTIIVRSARESDYYTLPDVKEKYVRLRGDVVLEVRDDKAGTVQVIKAASVTYNQTRRSVSAEGGVEYSLTRGGKTDTFTGESLAFNLDTSEAVFYEGSTTRSATQKEGGDIKYTFRGETMTRLSNDTVILSNGSLTSSDMPVDPYYQIKASQVWLLAPGEWAISNALLYIGRVPILYIPGLFWPGDDFFFNPNFGYRNREGTFIQTTTYLVGRKPKEDNAFSFLQIANSGDTGYALEPHGLFLRKVPTNEPAPAGAGNLKLMLDGYSHLGFLAGVAGDFSPLATFRTSLGLSRSIFTDTSSPTLYTPFLPDPPLLSGYSIGQQFWNTSSILGLTVPFRYGLEGTLKTTGDVFSANAAFQYFSDPYFTSDFYTRSEASLLSSLLDQATQTSQSSTATQQSNIAVQQSNLSWDFSMKLDLTKLIGQSSVRDFSMPNLGLKFTWQSYTLGSTAATSAWLVDPLVVDPGRTYYYLSSITAPSVSFSFAGDIVKLSNSAPQPIPAPTGALIGVGGVGSVTLPTSTSAAPGAADPGKGVRLPPGYQALPPKGQQSTAHIPFRAPGLQQDLTTTAHPLESTLGVSYQVQPRLNLEHTFDAAASQAAGKADYTILYRTLETGGTSSVTTTASLWDKTVDLSETLSVDALWRNRFDPSASELALSSTDPNYWPNLLLGDALQDKISLRSLWVDTLRPFPAIPALSGSNLQYRLGVRLFQVSYIGSDPLNPVYGTTGPSWTSDAVSEHTIQSSLVFNYPGTTDSLALSAQLPPLVPTYTGLLNIGVGVVKAKVQGGVSQSDGVTLYQPLIMGATLDFGTPFSASEELQFDLQSAALSQSTLQLKAFGFTGTFVQQRMYPVDFMGNTIGTDYQFLPSTLTVGYELGGDPVWFWQDRIKMSLSLKTHWYTNLQKYTDNLFDFSLNLNLSINKALDLTFSSVSNNTRTYLYVPGWASAMGEMAVNPLTDLLQSFNFFDDQARQRSGFKINSLSVKAVQHLHDWDLIFQYQGSPQLRVDSSSQYTNIWTPTFSIQVQWNAVPQIKSNIHQDATSTYPLLR